MLFYAGFQISKFMKDMGVWDFQMLAKSLHFQIFPNSLKREKLGATEYL